MSQWFYWDVCAASWRGPYLIRWDAAAKETVIRFANASIPAATPLRYRATSIAKQSDLLEALIQIDFEVGVSILKTSSIPQLKQLGTMAVYENLLNTSISKAEAITKVRAIEPNFQI